MRVSADPRNLVYPGISGNDNHRNDLVPRMLRNAISAFTGVCDALWPARGAPLIRGPSGASRPCGAAQECCAGSGPRCSRPPREAVQAIGQMSGCGYRSAAPHGPAALRERGRRRTRQDQISLGLSPVKLRTARIRTERRKLVSSAGPGFERANSWEIRSSRLT
jgi:hypothetical protein